MKKLLVLLVAALISCAPPKDGAPGPAGPAGPPGAPGLPADAIPVKFCPSYTGAYPGPFPEYGLCMGGNLYAVYWDKKNAWLAQVYPGHYASTSTSAPCSFTVLPACKVQED